MSRPDPEPPAPLIELRRVEKVYGRGSAVVRALAGVSFAIDDGEFVAAVGSSGSGKSTAMNVIGALDQPTSGSYLFRGIEVTRLDANALGLLRRHYIGFVFQSFNLLPRTSALHNVELPLVYRGIRAAERRRRALDALDAVGLAARAEHAPDELSGGQQQRVAIARALVTDPALLVADEPTGNLDTAHKCEIMRLLSELNQQRGISVVMVTHEADIARWARRIIEFRDGLAVKDSPNTPTEA